MSTRKSGTAARRWAFGICAALVMASGCRQILGVEDPVPCESSAACALEGEPCVATECVDGACVYSQVAAGSPPLSDVAGDCSETVCDESGEAVTTVDTDDAPADDTVGDCKAPVCSSDGSVGSDVAEADVPDDDAVGDCRVPVCNSDGSIGSEIAETDVPADAIPDDCKVPACDADGNVVLVDDPNGCDCEVGDQLPCYDGPVGTETNSPCKGGMAVCEVGGTLGECLGQVLPTPDSCFSTSVDEDCSGNNNECLGDDVWAWGFGGSLTDGAVAHTYLQSDDPFGGDALAVVLFTESVDIDGAMITGGASLESVLVRITRQGDVTPGPQFSAVVASVTRRNQLVYLGAYVRDGMSEDFGSGGVIAPIGNSDGVIAALNEDDLTLAWKQRIVSSAGGDESVAHVEPRVGGGVVVQGKSSGAVVFEAGGTTFAPLSASDEFLVAYSETGVVEWVTRWPESTYAIADVAVDPASGNVYVCGSSSEALVVTANGTATTLHADPPSVDGWVFRVDGGTGAVSTAIAGITKIASPGTDNCDAITILPDGGRAIAGTIAQTVTITPVTLTHTNTVDDAFVMTTTSGGTPVAAKMFDITAGLVEIASIDAGSDGAIMVGGRFQGGSLTIGNATAIDAPSGRNDLFIAKFTPSLGELPGPSPWPRHYFTPGGDLIMNELRIGQDLGAVVSGVMTAAFSIGGEPTAYVDDTDAFVFKITQ